MCAVRHPHFTPKSPEIACLRVDSGKDAAAYSLRGGHLWVWRGVCQERRYARPHLWPWNKSSPWQCPGGKARGLRRHREVGAPDEVASAVTREMQSQECGTQWY